jgi:thiol-disulfide isomerase/thioredoxin
MTLWSRVGLLVVIALPGCSLSPGTLPRESLTMAPLITGLDVERRPMQLDEFRGQVVLLDFWTTNCGPCVKMNAHDRRLVAKYAGRPFVVLGVNADTSLEQVARTQQAQNLPFRSWWDGGPGGPIQQQWGIRAYPTVFLIDHRGQIRFDSLGEPPMSDFEREIEQLVREAEQDRTETKSPTR